MIANWRIVRTPADSRPSIWGWVSGLRQLGSPQPSDQQQAALTADSRSASSSREYIHGQIHASLQHDGLLPISEVKVSGREGSMTCKGWVVPFFGHVIESEFHTAAPAGEGPSNGDGGSSRWKGKPPQRRVVERCFGSGESTYFYQLDRFVSDLLESSPGTRR